MQVSHQSTNFRWLPSAPKLLSIIRSAPTSQIDSAFRARAHREHTEADPKETLCTPKGEEQTTKTHKNNALEIDKPREPLANVLSVCICGFSSRVSRCLLCSPLLCII